MNPILIAGKHVLAEIPSASGIELIKNSIFIIGDNSPYIYKIDSSYKLIDKYQVLSLENVTHDQIPKKKKPDFEATTVIEYNNQPALLILGSGSRSPQRDIALIVSPNKTEEIKIFSLEIFYQKLREHAKLNREDMNIEAATILNSELLLFNRGKNSILKYNLKEFTNHLFSNAPPPVPAVYSFTLPLLNNIQAGFSGACTIPGKNKILFTASVENTSNWIDDGEVYGSFIGIIDSSQIEKGKTELCHLLTENKKTLPVKVESVAFYQTLLNNDMLFLLVTDSDGGQSELIEVIVPGTL